MVTVLCLVFSQVEHVLSGIGTDRPARRRLAALDHPVPGGRERQVPGAGGASDDMTDDD